MTARDSARAAGGRRWRAFNLQCIAQGLYVAPVPRRLMHVDVPLLAASAGLDNDTPARRRALGRHAIGALRELGCRWPIAVHYQGVAGRQ
jgi:hypothetical protein